MDIRDLIQRRAVLLNEYKAARYLTVSVGFLGKSFLPGAEGSSLADRANIGSR